MLNIDEQLLRDRREPTVLAKRKADEPVRKRRERGHPSKMTGFRCPLELLKAADEEDGVQAQGIIVLLDRAVDAKNEMGDDWPEVMARAYREGISEGEALARMARESLRKTRR